MISLGQNPYRVALWDSQRETYDCECGYPGQYHMPCRHILAVAKEKNWSYKISWIATVCKEFLNDDYLALLGSCEMQMVSLEDLEQVRATRHPPLQRRAGRPRKFVRLESHTPVYLCSECGNLGHDIRRCPSLQAPPRPLRKRPRACRISTPVRQEKTVVQGRGPAWYRPSSYNLRRRPSRVTEAAIVNSIKCD